MEINDLTASHIDAIKKFVLSDEFLEIKDAFVSHTPEGGTDGNRNEGDSKNLGKLLGTRYVFNQLEKIARSKPKQPDTGKKDRGAGRQSGADPDLE